MQSGTKNNMLQLLVHFVVEKVAFGKNNLKRCVVVEEKPKQMYRNERRCRQSVEMYNNSIIQLRRFFNWSLNGGVKRIDKKKKEVIINIQETRDTRDQFDQFSSLETNKK